MAEIDRRRHIDAAHRASKLSADSEARITAAETAATIRATKRAELDFLTTKTSLLHAARQEGERIATSRLQHLVDAEVRSLHQTREEAKRHAEEVTEAIRREREGLQAERRALREESLRQLERMEEERDHGSRTVRAARAELRAETAAGAAARQALEKEQRRLESLRAGVEEEVETRVTAAVKAVREEVAGREAAARAAEDRVADALRAVARAELSASEAVEAEELSAARAKTAAHEASRHKSDAASLRVELAALRERCARLSEALVQVSGERDAALLRAGSAERRVQAEHSDTEAASAELMARVQRTEAALRAAREETAVARAAADEAVRDAERRAHSVVEASSKAERAESAAAKAEATRAWTEAATRTAEAEAASAEADRERSRRITAEDETARLVALLAVARRETRTSGAWARQLPHVGRVQDTQRRMYLQKHQEQPIDVVKSAGIETAAAAGPMHGRSADTATEDVEGRGGIGRQLRPHDALVTAIVPMAQPTTPGLDAVLNASGGGSAPAPLGSGSPRQVNSSGVGGVAGGLRADDEASAGTMESWY